jgi:hypothetical protein
MAEETETVDEAMRADAAKPAFTVPFVITLVALLIFFGFQTLSLLNERSNLSQVKSNQEGALQEAQKVQGQFKLLVTKVNGLAEQGHAGAKMIMEGLQRQGVGLVPESSAPEKPATKATK